MTRLSLSLFWLIASIGHLKSRYPNGDYPQSELYLIEYLTSEALQVHERDGRREQSGTEKVQAEIVASLAAISS